MHNTVTPSRVRHRAAAVALTLGPAAVGVMLAWGFDRLPDRPHLVLMVFLLLLTTALSAGIVASLAHCHLTVQRAFLAGLHAQHGHAAPARPTPLRVVD